jgi:hypothetical protein
MGASTAHIIGRARSARDNTVTTNALSTRSRSSTILDGMGFSLAVGNNGQVLRKVEGLAWVSRPAWRQQT